MFPAKARFVRRDNPPSLTTDLLVANPMTQPAIYSTCRAMWRKGSWPIDLAGRLDVQRWGKPPALLCPVCHRVDEGIPASTSHQTRSVLEPNRSQIRNPVRKAGSIAAVRNSVRSLPRTTQDSRCPMLLETTSEQPAGRLDRESCQACCWRLAKRFSDMDNLGQIYWWRREAAEPEA